MNRKRINNLLSDVFNSILRAGTKEIPSYIDKQRVIYFNSILLALPIIYLAFVLYDFRSYLKPLTEWYFDQYSFFIYLFICLFCFYLNYLNKANYSKIIFIITWPIVLQLAPIIIQTTPDDYYYAFPMGIIFHSLMIQIIFNNRNSPWQFWFFLIANFVLAINFLNILLYFDTDGRNEFIWLTKNKYYLFDTILYWLLFNLVANYLLSIIDIELLKAHKAKTIIEKQKNDLEVTLDELQESNTQIIRSEKMTSLGILTAGVAHEINNPLNFIMGGLYGLNEYFQDSKKNDLTIVSNYLESIEHGVERISTILNSLNQFSRHNIICNEDFDIHHIIENCLTFLKNKTSDRISIKKEFFTESISLLGNVGELHQLFINILINSIQAIENEGIIFIKTLKEKDYITIEISDTGCGIPEMNIPKITDPFFTTKDPGEGTGLGLSIVYKIVQEHQGDIEFKSEINKGTTVKISLPIKK